MRKKGRPFNAVLALEWSENVDVPAYGLLRRFPQGEQSVAPAALQADCNDGHSAEG